MRGRLGMAWTASVAVLAACGGDDPPVTGPRSAAGLTCDIPDRWIFTGTVKDAIPALTNPEMVSPDDPAAGYLRPEDRVVGLMVDGEALALPLNVFWWHEVINLDLGDRHLAVTHCPLTGSSLAFDRAPVGDAEFGVSGLLYLNNLIMYDRARPESFWPQMARRAACGAATGTPLPMVASIEMSWDAWQRLHPDTRVVSEFTNVPRNYQQYPYGAYDNLANPDLLYPIPGSIDGRRLPKERMLGIPSGQSGGLAFPFGALAALGRVGVVEASVDGSQIVVFWDGGARAAMAYVPVAEVGSLAFRVEDDRIRDVETGSTWRVDGLATAGPLRGVRLEPVAEAFISYWFAWALFYEEAQLWEGT